LTTPMSNSPDRNIKDIRVLRRDLCVGLLLRASCDIVA
jgi:hypothetical protein